MIVGLPGSSVAGRHALAGRGIGSLIGSLLGAMIQPLALSRVMTVLVLPRDLCVVLGMAPSISLALGSDYWMLRFLCFPFLSLVTDGCCRQSELILLPTRCCSEALVYQRQNCFRLVWGDNVSSNQKDNGEDYWWRLLNHVCLSICKHKTLI